MLSADGLLGAIEVVVEERLVAVVGAVVDDDACALFGREAAQIGETAVGHQDLGVMLGVVDVADHGNDGGDGTVLAGERGSHEEGQVGVAGEVAGAADAVLDLGAHDVSGVDVAVDVAFDHGVHGNDAETADDAGVVGDLLGAEDDAVAIVAQVGVDFLNHVRAEGERGARGDSHLAGLEEAIMPSWMTSV